MVRLDTSSPTNIPFSNCHRESPVKKSKPGVDDFSPLRSTVHSPPLNGALGIFFIFTMKLLIDAHYQPFAEWRRLFGLSLVFCTKGMNFHSPSEKLADSQMQWHFLFAVGFCKIFLPFFRYVFAKISSIKKEFSILP